MITLLEEAGAAIWRASWQAAVLALLVILLVRALGERIPARWRYWLFGIVVLRLLIVATPASPWSAFNLVRLIPERGDQRIALRDGGSQAVPDPSVAKRIAPQSSRATQTTIPPARNVGPPAGPGTQPTIEPVTSPYSAPPQAQDRMSPSDPPARDVSVGQILAAVWLAGVLVIGLQLLGATRVLRRRLSICRPVTDPAVCAMLAKACEQMGLRRQPALLVTPEAISPCIVGTWRPRIVVPESIVTDSSSTKLGHVLAHELAHLVRGDAWTNWLLLAVRGLHWFNPAAWWTVREMRAACEAACDDVALVASGEADRSAYAATIIELAASLAPSGVAPAMIGLISSTRRLTNRIERLVRAPSVVPLAAPIAAGIMLSIALLGLTDAMPAATATQSAAKSAPVPEKGDGQAAKTVTLRGLCVDQPDKSAIPGALVRLFKAQGRTAPIVEVAKTKSDQSGRFEFPSLDPPRASDPVDPLIYLVFGEAAERPIGVGGIWNGQERNGADVKVWFHRDKTTLSGTVKSADGRPVAGAAVAQWAIDGRPVPGILSAMTGPDGRFVINRIPYYEWLRNGGTGQRSLTFSVSHPGFPEESFEVRELPRNVTVTLSSGCRVTGTVTDSVTGKPAAGALVVAERQGQFSETAAATGAAGRFEMALAEDRYNFSARAKDRVCVALVDRECLAGETLALPPFKLESGGFIAGQVVDAKTGEAIAVTAAGQPIAIGLYGPASPQGKTGSAARMAHTDRAGRFVIRAAPGENFPYLVNFHGDRMSWDTTKQPAVKVKAGETTSYNMLVTPRISREEKLRLARKVIEQLSKKPSDRTDQILVEFRKLEHTVDETELWCSLMRELVAVGADAVPQLCAELDRTTEDRTLRRLAFALRAIGDPRAVTALIRAIPRTLVAPSSDYGLIVADGALAEFMQKHDLRAGRRGGRYFDFGRAPREVFGALQKLTGQSFNDSEVMGIHRSDDPRRQILQRRLFMRQARRWQTWWEAHWGEFTVDAAYRTVGLPAFDDALPPATFVLGPHARLTDGVMGATLSPAIEQGEHAEYFYDLDTGAHLTWPAHIPKDEVRFDPKQLAAWAAANGVDVMCVTDRAANEKETFVLRSLGMKVWEISPRDLRNIEKLIAAGTLPKGRDAGELLVHYDDESKRSVPDANAAFVYITRDGSMGLIETTDRVTRAVDISGMGSPPAGAGFHKGVRFNLKSIVP